MYNSSNPTTLRKREKKGRPSKIPRSDVVDCVCSIVYRERFKDVFELTAQDLRSELKILKDIDVTAETVRNRCWNRHGYFYKKYRDVMEYIRWVKIGKNRYDVWRIDVDGFLERMEDENRLQRIIERRTEIYD